LINKATAATTTYCWNECRVESIVGEAE